jgi:hypothetical protein
MTSLVVKVYKYTETYLVISLPVYMTMNTIRILYDDVITL